jgi:hypothetical protein
LTYNGHFIFLFLTILSLEWINFFFSSNQLKIFSLYTSISLGISVDPTPPPSPLSNSYKTLDKNMLIPVNPKLPIGLSSFFLAHNTRPDCQLVEFGNKYFIRSSEGTCLGTEWDRLWIKESILKWTKILTCIFFGCSVCHLLYCFCVGLVLCLKWPQWTSSHQHTIHWMPVITQLWMNLNWVSIWFHFDNQFCNK